MHAMAQDMRPLTPPVKRSMENLTFSTPSAHLYEDNEHSLWSSSFTSERGACEARPRSPTLPHAICVNAHCSSQRAAEGLSTMLHALCTRNPGEDYSA